VSSAESATETLRAPACYRATALHVNEHLLSTDDEVVGFFVGRCECHISMRNVICYESAAIVPFMSCSRSNTTNP